MESILPTLPTPPPTPTIRFVEMDPEHTLGGQSCDLSHTLVNTLGVHTSCASSRNTGVMMWLSQKPPSPSNASSATTASAAGGSVRAPPPMTAGVVPTLPPPPPGLHHEHLRR